MITVSKTTLKSRMPAFFRQVEDDGETLIVTEHRRPVLRVERIAPVKSPMETLADLRGGMKGRVADVLAPESAAWGELT